MLAPRHALGPNLFQRRGHDLGAVVDGENNVGDAGCGQALDLVQDHGLVGEFDQRLRQGKGLGTWSMAVRCFRPGCGRGICIREGASGCQTHRQE